MCDALNQIATTRMPHCSVVIAETIQKGCPIRPATKPNLKYFFEENRPTDAQLNMMIAIWVIMPPASPTPTSP